MESYVWFKLYLKDSPMLTRSFPCWSIGSYPNVESLYGIDGALYCITIFFCVDLFLSASDGFV